MTERNAALDLRSAPKVGPKHSAPPISVDIDLSGMTSSWCDDDSEVTTETVNESAAMGKQSRRNAGNHPCGNEGTSGATSGAIPKRRGPPGKDSTDGAARGDRSAPRRVAVPPSDVEVIEDDEDAVTYARVVTRSGWNMVPNKKRKRDRSGNKNLPTLRGVKSTVKKILYVQGLDYSLCTCFNDLEDIVYNYCHSRGVTVSDCCTIPKAKSRVEANCKVTVSEADYERLSDPNFWPEDIEVRPWEQRPRRNRRGDSDESRE